jgi:ubiquinone/menaquinone biosynthesis C-methylase UbiE
MTTPETHHDVVLAQYDSRAAAYLNSPVHAAGADLDAMARLVGQQPDAVALDMGCGGGHVSLRLAPQVGKVVACDLSAEMLATVAAEAGRRGLSNVVVMRTSAEALPCPDAAFDVVATRFSAHHWAGFEAGLAQMRRVAKPGALALFADIVSPGVRLLDTWFQAIELLRDPSHIHNRAVGEWTAALAQAGFAIESVTTARLRLEFASWIERMRTPQAHVAAIQSLLARAPGEVREHYEIGPDGSFTADTALFVARAV